MYPMESVVLAGPHHSDQQLQLMPWELEAVVTFTVVVDQPKTHSHQRCNTSSSSNLRHTENNCNRIITSTWTRHIMKRKVWPVPDMGFETVRQNLAPLLAINVKTIRLFTYLFIFCFLHSPGLCFARTPLHLLLWVIKASSKVLKFCTTSHSAASLKLFQYCPTNLCAGSLWQPFHAS